MEENEKQEKIQKLMEKTGATENDARMALEAADWDMFDAFCNLEKQGKATDAGKNFSTENTYQANQNDYNYQNRKSMSFGEALGKGFHWCVNMIKKGMDNDFVIEKMNMNPIRIPITITVLLALILNGFALVLLIVGLFFGFRYSFRGPNIHSASMDEVNQTLNNVGQKAEDFTNSVKDGYRKE
jgi:hypothetical protein